MSCRKITSKTAEGFDRLRLPDYKNIGVDDNMKESSLKQTDKIINMKKVFDNKIGEKPQNM
jgi:hypothetical protein